MTERTPGRPRLTDEGMVHITFTATTAIRDWLRKQQNTSETIRRLVEQEMEKMNPLDILYGPNSKSAVLADTESILMCIPVDEPTYIFPGDSVVVIRSGENHFAIADNGDEVDFDNIVDAANYIRTLR